MNRLAKRMYLNRNRSLLGAIGVVVVFALAGVSAIYFSQAAATNQPPEESLSPSDAALREQSISSQSKLIPLLQDVRTASAYRYNSTDSAGKSMAAAKIIDNPSGGYLAVYHSANTVKLASSTDLLKWTFRADLDRQGSQPTIIASSDGGFIVAHEHSTQPSASSGQLRLMHYPDLNALYAGKAAKVFTAPRTLTTCSEGTPSIYSVQLNPDITNSVISLGMHYRHNCDTDRQATGRLVNFTTWTASPHPNLTLALTRGAQAVGVTVKGDIGDRDSLNLDNSIFNLHEVQYVKSNAASWRPYLVNSRTGQAQLLKIKTHGNSTSLAKPAFTIVKSPTSGGRALVAGYYIHSEGAASGEAGQLLYYKEL